MKAFDALTARGRGLRLREMALAALEHYDVEPRSVRLVANHLNGVFRVDTVDGQTYTLRISHPAWRTIEDLRSELAWLQALHLDTDIGAPEPLPARGGDLIAPVSTGGVPEPRRCVLFTWLPGPLLAERLSEGNLERLGVLAARLHAHAAGFIPPEGSTTRKLNAIYARGERDELFSDTSREIFTPETRAIFERAVEHVSDAFDRLYADRRGLRVIHNDLHHENVKVFRGRLRPFDFEDTIWGYPVQDIAMTFFDLLDYTDPAHADYRLLRAAFQRGYTGEAPWPEAYPGQIDSFIAGRQIWRANWVAQNATPYARRFVDGMAPRLQVFLDTGDFPR